MILEGGNMGGASLVEGSVRRTAGEWTATIQRLLGHLRARGISWVPAPLGVDPDGRDHVSYLPGVVPQCPLPAWVWSDAVLTQAASFLALLHSRSADFPRDSAVWQFASHSPPEVICHNDFAPYNMVFKDGHLTGVIDWDTASPGPRVWDVAYLAYRLVPLAAPTNPDALQNSDEERSRRLHLLCDTYGHGLTPQQVLSAAVTRLHDLADFTEARAPTEPDVRAHAGEQPDPRVGAGDQPDLRAPAGDQPDLRAPAGDQPDLRAPAGDQPDLRAPACDQPDLRAPAGDQPDLQAPAGDQPDVRVGTDGRLGLAAVGGDRLGLAADADDQLPR